MGFDAGQAFEQVKGIGVMRKIIIALAVAASGLAAMPASAQPFVPQYQAQRQIQREISQLDNQIQRATQRRTISFREAQGLRRDAMKLQQQLSRYSRNGLDRFELAQLQGGLNRVHQQLRVERNDWDGRRG